MRETIVDGTTSFDDDDDDIHTAQRTVDFAPDACTPSNRMLRVGTSDDARDGTNVQM